MVAIGPSGVFEGCLTATGVSIHPAATVSGQIRYTRLSVGGGQIDATFEKAKAS